MTSNNSTKENGNIFSLFLGSAFFSGLADGTFKVIVPLLAITITHSPEAVGIAAAMVWLPWPFLALFIGGIADRRTPLGIMWAGELTRVFLTLILVLLSLAEIMNIWLFILCVFVVGAGSVAVDIPAQAVVPRIVGPTGLARANGRFQLVQLGTVQLLGPPAAGYLVALGVSGSLGLISISFLISAVLLAATMRGINSHAGVGEQAERIREPVFASFIAGIRYIAKRADVLRISLQAGVSNFAFAGIIATLPLFAVEPGPLGLSTTEYGFLFASGAAGGIIMGFSSHVFAMRIGERLTLQASVPFLGVFIVLISVGNVWLVAVGLFGYGAVIMLWNVVSVTYRQTTVPPELLNRVNATYRWISWGAMPVGASLGGVLVGAIGSEMYFIILAMFASLSGALFAPRNRHFHSAYTNE
ncbi:MFS transporter [Lipingzhangella sp. LS1_29]|uniref:MFS transporter n=1 Tax=Lipingzhangella rawalii TaxID=2055835 RepID=A0ABU2HCV4_9ACTN|nr:MFS transporter [Lipingzhangella rawalii]MDS1272670.1 MFS transporter [Lipingzhangella rawalii]